MKTNKTLIEWNVRLANGEWLGVVVESRACLPGEDADQHARCAALSKFGDKIGQRGFSVDPRD